MGSHHRLLSNHTMVAISLVITGLSILILGTQDVRGYYPAPTCSGPPWVCLRNRSPVIRRPMPVQFGARGGYYQAPGFTRPMFPRPPFNQYWRLGAPVNRMLEFFPPLFSDPPPYPPPFLG